MSTLSDAQALIEQAKQKRDEAVNGLARSKESVLRLQANLIEAGGYGDLGEARSIAAGAGFDSGDIADAFNTISEAVQHAVAACGGAVDAIDAEIGKLNATEFPNLGGDG